MKRIIVVFAISLVGIFMTCCSCNKKEPSKTDQILRSDHELRRMIESKDFNATISDGFFLCLGGFDGNAKTITSIKFAWEISGNNIYAISALPLEKIRIKLDEKATTPTIKFYWDESWHTFTEIPNDLQWFVNDIADYAVLTVRECDWPIQINLPLGSK